jgi:hypothetical protein
MSFPRPNPGYLDLQALAAYTSISVRTWRDYLKRPDAPPVIRLPGKLLVARADADAFLLRFKEAPGQDLAGVVAEVMGKFGDTKSGSHASKRKGKKAAVAGEVR